MIAAALALALILSFLSPLFGTDAVEGTAPFVAAVRAAKAGLQDADRVIVHPPWRDDVAAAIRDANILPPGVDASEAFAPRHAEPWGAIGFVLERGAPLPATLANRIAAHGKVLADQNGVQVVLVDDTSAASSDFSARLSKAQVTIEKQGGDITRCKWDAVKRRHTCPGHPGWMHVGLETVVTNKKNERCIWAHPTTGGKVAVRFEGVTVDKELELSHALADSAMRNKSGKPVTASVFVGGALVGRHAKQNRPGFDRKRLTVPEGKRGKNKNVRVEITTRDDGARHYCFRLRSVGGKS